MNNINRTIYNLNLNENNSCENTAEMSNIRETNDNDNMDYTLDRDISAGAPQTTGPELPELESQQWDQLLPTLLTPSDDFESRWTSQGPSTQVSNEPKYSAEDLAKLGVETQDGYVDASVLYALERGEHPCQQDGASNLNNAAISLPHRPHTIHPKRPANDTTTALPHRPRLRNPRKRNNTNPSTANLRRAHLLKSCAPCRFSNRPCTKVKEDPKTDIPCERCLGRETNDWMRSSDKQTGFNAKAFCHTYPNTEYIQWWDARHPAQQAGADAQADVADKPNNKKVHWADQEGMEFDDAKNDRDQKSSTYRRKKLVFLPGEVVEEEEEEEEEEEKEEEEEEESDAEMKDV